MKNLMLFGRLFIALCFIAASIDVTSVDAQMLSCNSLCKFPHMCQVDSGKCLCAVGWTGPNAFYIEGNRVLADYCNQACFYNQFAQSAICASTTTTTTTTTTPTTTTTTPTTTTTTPTTTTTTTTPTTTTTTTRSPSDILAELIRQIKDALELLAQLEGRIQ